MTRIYLDHAATTPMAPEAVEAMSRELGRIGNASSLHGSGRAARRVVEEARESIAAHVGAQPAELIFTSGGTEADNLAVKGAYWSLAPQGRTKVIISAVEHHAVLDSAGWLAQSAGATTHQVPVDAQGRLDRQALADAVDDTTALVSLMWANNEVGTRQPVELAAALARQQGALSHSDAVQAVGHLAVHFGRSGLDLMTFTAHKLGGPYGIGALLARREVKLTATQHGGGQERELRSGTFDVAAAAGFAAALEVAVRGREQEEARIRALRTELIGAVRAAVGDVVLHGTLDPADSLPGVTNLGFPGCRSDSLLMLLDESGIDCSAGSACSSGVPEPSYVLSAMGVSDEAAQSAVRFSLGHSSTSADVQALAAALPTAVQRSRAAAAFA